VIVENNFKDLVLSQDECVGVRSIDGRLGYEIFARAENGEDGWYDRFLVSNVVEKRIVLS
jgi:hypothetical protein